MVHGSSLLPAASCCMMLSAAGGAVVRYCGVSYICSTALSFFFCVETLMFLCIFLMRFILMTIRHLLIRLVPAC